MQGEESHSALVVALPNPQTALFMILATAWSRELFRRRMITREPLHTAECKSTVLSAVSAPDEECNQAPGHQRPYGNRGRGAFQG